ncbi:MAG: fused MFS/spermidine synthase [Gammaproteobacteria bacterium]
MTAFKWQGLIVLFLFFLSGLSALIYEVLWLKELGLLFGNASYAMATTLAAFFLGLAVGGYRWGGRAAGVKNPLKLYGFLELGVAVCALGYFLILKAYAFTYPLLFDWFGQERMLWVAAKFVLSMLVLFPPAYFMGGTLPVISHYAVDHGAQLGQRVSVLYAINTLGAVVGVFLAGFYLPILIGYRQCYLAAICTTVLVSLTAFIISGAADQSKQKPGITRECPAAAGKVNRIELDVLAFLSGFLMLSLQVLWGRMFAQTLQNSVYTFSVILMVFLFCLALGSLSAKRLMQTWHNHHLSLFVLLTAGSLLVAATPFEFLILTDDLNYLGTDENWSAYLIKVLISALAVMGPPLLLLGGVFPYLMKLNEKPDVIAGSAVGRLVSMNTAGAIVGSLAAGFVILDSLGLWSGIRLMAVIYVMAAWFWLGCSKFHRSRMAIFPAFLIFLFVSILDTSKLPVVRVDPVNEDESLLEVWEGSAGTVAVVRRGDNLQIKVNNHYTLGGSGSMELEQLQGYLPLLLHENPQSVYVLGLGTGITAGAGLAFPIKKLIVTELVPEVVTASDRYFGRYTNSLFYDPRAVIVQEDGRNYLRGTRKSFDVIIGDLFVPWKAGVGNLYSLEHYQVAKKRLNKGGLFMQWLPTYQLTDTEFDIIAKTMLEVFPLVTVWRGDYSALKPIVGLLGHESHRPLSKHAWLFRQDRSAGERVPLLAHYVGNLTAVGDRFSGVRPNTDDRPLIEFQAPVSQRLTKSGEADWLVGEQLITFMQRLAEDAPYDRDEYLNDLEKKDAKLPAAGLHLHKAQLLKQQGRLTAAQKEFEMFEKNN